MNTRFGTMCVKKAQGILRIFDPNTMQLFKSTVYCEDDFDQMQEDISELLSKNITFEQEFIYPS